jgi:hypothetical protein
METKPPTGDAKAKPTKKKAIKNLTIPASLTGAEAHDWIKLLTKGKKLTFTITAKIH